jgi:Helix-turn-helix domain
LNTSLNPQAITAKTNLQANPQVTAPKSFFGVSAVAARWGVHQNFVYNLIKSNELPCLRIGNPGTKRPVIRIPLDSLEAWEAKQLEGGAK